MAGKISGIILAGGTASRYNGIMKPKIVIGGELIITRILSAITDIFDEVIIVTNNPAEFSDFSFCRIVQDEIIGAGPLGGIHAGMKASSCDAVFVFAGDMPFLNKEIIASIIETFRTTGCDAVVPRIGNFIEPLHSVYNNSITDNLESYLKGDLNKAVREYIKTLNVHYLLLEGSEKNRRAFTNVNSPSDIFPANG